MREVKVENDVRKRTRIETETSDGITISRRRWRRATRGAWAVVGVAVVAALMIGSTVLVTTSVSLARAAPTPSSGTPLRITLSTDTRSSASGSLPPTPGGSGRPTAQTVTVTYYNYAGYAGSNTIYPTSYQTVVSLPTAQSQVYQVSSNASKLSAANMMTLTANKSGAQPPRFWYDTNAKQFMVYVGLDAVGGAMNFTIYNTQYCTVYDEDVFGDAMNIETTPSGLPSSNTNLFAAGTNNGLNVTTGNDQEGTTGGDMTALVSLALDLASLIATPEIGIILTLASIGIDLGDLQSVGATNSGSHTTTNDVAGDATANQWVMTTGGLPGKDCLNGGSFTPGYNVYSDAVLSEQQIPASALSSVTAGRLSFSAYDELNAVDTPANTVIGTWDGPTATISYPVEPASSVGGTVYLYKNAGCGATCPVVPGASVLFQQTGGHAIVDYNETGSSGGYWHFFMEPYTGNPNNDCMAGPWYNTSATFSDALGSVTTGPTAVPCWLYDTEGSNNTTALSAAVNGGMVSGTVLGYGSGAWSGVSGATVKLCNNKGCISTTSGSGGTYSLEYPVAGTSSNPYTMTISASGWPTVTYNNLLLGVGATTTKNLYFTPSYPVTFTESGLASGTSWSITLAGTKESSTTSTITFSEENGSYTYTVGAVSGYTSSSSGGTVVVNGGPVNVPTITFSLPPYTATFQESNLTSGDTWEVSVNGNGKTATAPSSIVFSGLTTSGSWDAYDVIVVSNACELVYWAPSPSSGTVHSTTTITVKYTEYTKILAHVNRCIPIVAGGVPSTSGGAALVAVQSVSSSLGQVTVSFAWLSGAIGLLGAAIVWTYGRRRMRPRQ